MSAHLNQVSKNYLAFKNRKLKIREEHKRLLQQGADEEKLALGEAIWNAREAGFRVDEIMLVMGLKNRNFLYEALSFYKDSDKPEVPVVVEEPDAPSTQDDLTVTRLDEHTFSVSLLGEVNVLTVSKQGQIANMPESWLRDLDSVKKTLVKEAIKQILEQTGSN